MKAALSQPAVRRLIKGSLYRGGVTPAYHRKRNRRSLTVVMFHRVLPAGDPEWAEAEPVWTVSDLFFQDCLRFFERHYRVIGIPELLRARRSGGDLPDCSLLITFDDGWADTEWCALPILKAHGLPAVVFAVAGGIGGQELWQEGIRRAWRQRRLSTEDWDRTWTRLAANRPAPQLWDATAVESLIGELGTAKPETRRRILEKISSQIGHPYRAQMLTEEQLRSLHAAGVAVGSHGFTHIPIPDAEDQSSELRRSRACLAAALDAPETEINTLSFPHGIYSHAAVNAAFNLGYECLFTSDKGLNAIPNGKAAPALLGRLNMDQPAICGGSEELRPEMLASWLFGRPFCRLGITPEVGVSS